VGYQGSARVISNYYLPSCGWAVFCRLTTCHSLAYKHAGKNNLGGGSSRTPLNMFLSKKIMSIVSGEQCDQTWPQSNLTLFYWNCEAFYLKVAGFSRPGHSNDIDLAMVKRFKDNRQYKVYMGNHRWDSRMVMEFSNGTSHLSSVHNKVSPIKPYSEFWDECGPEYKPKAARTSEHPTLTVLRTLSASARPGLTSCCILHDRVNDCPQTSQDKLVPHTMRSKATSNPVSWIASQM